jgi:hypothetical protein
MLGVGELGRDKWIPNPSAKSPFCMKMFEFVGKLLGIAIRSKNPLPLDLPVLFWKSLVRNVALTFNILSTTVYCLLFQSN